MRIVSALGDFCVSSRGVAAAVVALLSLGASGPALAGTTMSGAEKLHRLDLLLRASEARCEASGTEFRSDYAAFAGSQRDTLGKADHELRARLVRRYGRAGAEQAYRRMNVAIVSEYRQGHPWLACGDLKTVAHGLAMVRGSATLLEAADQILPDRGSPHFALVRD